MRKEDNGKTRLCVQYDDHSRLMCTILCSLMEHQSLVDLAIRCGNNTMHAHKCILAASSPYFREQLEKNPGTEQVIINGLDFPIMKSVIEFIYCGETTILEESLKYVVAAAKLFQIRGLQALAPESAFEGDDSINIPSPIFMNKKPKYSSAYIPFVPLPPSNQSVAMENNVNLNVIPIDSNNMQRRMKRKYVRTTIEAEKACAREARASRMALEALKKELGPTNQMHNFEIEDNCTETTVENFIPHVEEQNYINQIEVVNYSDLNQITSGQIMNLGKNLSNHNIIPFEMSTNTDKTIDKIRDVFCHEMQTNVEIMYKTPEGEFVKVTDEVLRNITGDTLQFQVIDENGREGEVQLLGEKIKIKPIEIEEPKKSQKFEDTFRDFINTTYSDAPQNPMLVQSDINTNCDVDCILLNDEIQQTPEQRKIETININDVASSSNQIKISPQIDCRVRTFSLQENDDHSDILKEINSMQYYDKSIYEDVADKFESAFQDNDKQGNNLDTFDQVGDNIMKHVEDTILLHVGGGDCEVEIPLKKMRTKNMISPKSDEENRNLNDEFLKYSPRKTRSNRQSLQSSSCEDVKSIDIRKKSTNKKK